MGLQEIQKLLTTKEMVSILKKPPTEWKKIFASYKSNKNIQGAQKTKHSPKSITQ
jgi:hypothetical protein